MHRACLICGVTVAILVGSGGFLVAQPAPNIVFVIVDDMGWTDLSGGTTNLGNPSDFYQTPNLETLATQGMSFTSAYTCGANCAPTRAALLSGQYAPRPTNNVYAVDNLNRGGSEVPLLGPDQGLASNGEAQIPGTTITLAETLKTAGYTTAHIGKYHVGDPNNTTDNNGPLPQGFDFNFGGTKYGWPGSSYFADGSGVYVSGNIGPELDTFASPQEHLTDAETDAAIDFMDIHAWGEPFFINLAYHAVHTPVTDQGRPDLVTKYEALPPGTNHDNVDYAALVEGVDEGVGRIVDYLNATDDPRNPGHKLADNTLLIFTSDNGGFSEETANVPLAGQKGELDEGGIRVPMIVWGVGVDANTINHTPIATIDFYTTFADLAEATLPADYVLDGESLVPLFADETASLTRESLYWHFPGYLVSSGRDQRPQSVLRKDIGVNQWKLLYNYEDESWELYNLATDLGEATNLASTETALVDELGNELALWLMDVEAPMPIDKATGLPVGLPGLVKGDINLDDAVDVEDWIILRSNLFSDLSALTPSEAYQLGDLDLDGWNDEQDFALFKSYYDDFSGCAGAFDEMVAGVPEPSTMVLGLVVVGLAVLRQRGKKKHAAVA